MLILISDALFKFRENFHTTCVIKLRSVFEWAELMVFSDDSDAIL